MRNKSCIVLCLLLSLCLLSGCASEPAAVAVEMQPTDCGLTGAFDAYLYVPLEGGTYRYERVDMPDEKASKGKQIYSFVEDTGFDQYDWQVYAVKEYPDYSHVWAESGLDYAQLYRYSPPKRSEDNALEMAREDGCVIMEDGDVTSGQETWMDFVAETERSNAASVKVAHYHTLNPERSDPTYYAAYKEDYPVLYINELTYDGEAFTLRWEEQDKQYERTYRYLMRYTGNAPKQTSATFDTYLRYVLTNDNTVTWEELQWDMLSSQFGDYIDHFTIYTDLKRDAE